MSSEIVFFSPAADHDAAADCKAAADCEAAASMCTHTAAQNLHEPFIKIDRISVFQFPDIPPQCDYLYSIFNTPVAAPVDSPFRSAAFIFRCREVRSGSVVRSGSRYRLLWKTHRIASRFSGSVSWISKRCWNCRILDFSGSHSFSLGDSSQDSQYHSQPLHSGSTSAKNFPARAKDFLQASDERSASDGMCMLIAGFPSYALSSYSSSPIRNKRQPI